MHKHCFNLKKVPNDVSVFWNKLVSFSTRIHKRTRTHTRRSKHKQTTRASAITATPTTTFLTLRIEAVLVATQALATLDDWQAVLTLLEDSHLYVPYRAGCSWWIPLDATKYHRGHLRYYKSLMPRESLAVVPSPPLGPFWPKPCKPFPPNDPFGCKPSSWKNNMGHPKRWMRC